MTLIAAETSCPLPGLCSAFTALGGSRGILLPVGRSSALPTKGPEPSQLRRAGEAEGAEEEARAAGRGGLAGDAGEAGGADAGRLGRCAPGPGAVSRHCCHSHASPSRIGLRGAGGGGGGGGGAGVVVLRAFGVTTTWLSKAVVGPKPCSLSKAASNASLLFPYSVLSDTGACVDSDIMSPCWNCCCCISFCKASSDDWPVIVSLLLIVVVSWPPLVLCVVVMPGIGGSVGMLNFDGSWPVAFINACRSLVSSWNCLMSSSIDGPLNVVVALCVVVGL